MTVSEIWLPNIARAQTRQGGEAEAGAGEGEGPLRPALDGAIEQGPHGVASKPSRRKPRQGSSE
jgi:hypothetical protein